MKLTESGKPPIIHANLNNLERELQRLVGSSRRTDVADTARTTGDAAHAPESAVIVGD